MLEALNGKPKQNVKTFKINIHSIIDVITNSSTEIFVTAKADSERYTKELIDLILKEGGSDKSCDDLFVVNYIPDDYDEQPAGLTLTAKSSGVTVDVVSALQNIIAAEEFPC